MKLRTLRYILTLVLLMCALFCTAPSAAAVSTEEMQQLLQEKPLKLHEYSYSTGSFDVSASVYYSHALLLQDSTTLSPDLAKSSLALSVSAYDGEAVSDLLESMDFTPVDNTAVYERSKSGLTVTDCDYAAYTIATAEITHPLKPVGQDDYIIYCVAIQGTPPNLEWLSDFNLGDGVYHEGFRKASEEIYYAVREMCKEDNYPSGRTILWLTGHSRGAACANLLASWFREREDYDVPVVKENVIAYTFACPAVSKEADPNMPGIYNFNNPGDLVTMLPLPEWGYGRYGQTIELDTSALGYGNFTTRYAAVTGETYAGTIDDQDFRAVLSEIGKSENTQLILDLVAWMLGGCNRDVLNEIILKNMPDDPQGFLSILEKAVPEAGVAVKVFDLVEFLYTQNEQNAGLISWAKTNYDDYLDATPEEFALFLQNNAATITRMEDITGIVITEPEDLRSARIWLETDSNNTLRLQSFIGSAADLICDGEGNIASKVIHAHTQPAYAIWINSMFYGHQGWYENPVVSEVSLDESYFSIGQHCFNNCDAIEEIVIPNSVTHVGNDAFYACYNVTSLTLPADLQYGTAFHGVSGLKTIRYTPGATGVMADRASDDTYTPEYQSQVNLQEIIFDDGITHIASYLCQTGSHGTRESLTSVTFPATLESIGERAFYNCYNTTFSDWPEGLTTIGAYTFYRCEKLTSYPSTLTAFPQSCFSECYGLTEIIIPDHFTEISNDAFYACYNVTSLTLPADLQYGTAFHGVSGLKTIRYTPGATGVMADRAYDDTYAPEYQSQGNLQEIIFDDGITHIAAYLCQVGRYGSRESLTAVTLPSTLESIGEYAFYNCYNAQFSNWPTGLTSIGNNAFYYCYNLGDFTFVGDAPTIGSNAFYNVTATGYYPQYNETWTVDTLQNYGGNLTWIPLSCDGEHVETTVKGTASTCDKTGLSDGTRCSLCGEPLQPQEEIPATGEHTSDESPGFTWDDSFACTAAFTCRDCRNQITVPCQITTTNIPAEDGKSAQIVYTATVVLGETTYTDTKTVDAPEVEVHIHTPEDQWQYGQITHWKQCTGCEEKMEAAKHTPDANQYCTVCGVHISIPPELNWFFEKLEEPDNYLWASGYYARIMERYADTLTRD